MINIKRIIAGGLMVLMSNIYANLVLAAGDGPDGFWMGAGSSFYKRFAHCQCSGVFLHHCSAIGALAKVFFEIAGCLAECGQHGGGFCVWAAHRLVPPSMTVLSVNDFRICLSARCMRPNAVFSGTPCISAISLNDRPSNKRQRTTSCIFGSIASIAC